ncbi:PPC domain-containing DNA-binding protein [Natranaerobius thermophilus]|uniref:PPC domain-containing protein n=1 Tax=Natranaerobius thermophilus (strain ATCC BAA-1301 / DSM 18059 / JW/NM-WN-LF) TaxID=457570 RepID=B2A706_NATTJ|nr:PPC domain-containing DNA-binding protein [Natranaerobius thermophilus]ACB85597.1 protein of unknown function DUF296 [Natranaerobius thermophilus JW/NM-WN-LF]
MKVKEFKQGRTFMGRLPKGEDLLTSIEAIAKEKEIKVARVELIGVVENAVVGFFQHDKKQYKPIKIDEHMEIVNAVGNISQKDGEIKAHIHITLGDQDGNTYSGHLMEGSNIFAGEIVMQELVGPELHRKYDESTGISLWDIN